MKKTLLDENASALLIETREDKRFDTVIQMSHTLSVLQEMGSRLANETHGDFYLQVSELNLSIHEVHLKLEILKIDGKRY